MAPVSKHTDTCENFPPRKDDADERQSAADSSANFGALRAPLVRVLESLPLHTCCLRLAKQLNSQFRMTPDQADYFPMPARPPSAGKLG